MKYETMLRLDFNNTMSIMVNEIKENSTILEFGPASGRLTQYLRDEKSCKMYIVELDEEAGKIASEFAEGTIIGDIESYEWIDKFRKVKFDYILFADVLEHLRNPEKVLEKCKEVLADEGYIMVSLPNIAHNSVIIDLLKGKFEYQKTGLLDNTHIRFWTYETIEKTFRELELNVEAKFGTYTQVGKNEFNNTYEDIEKLNPYVLKSRDMGEVYQFVYKVTKKQVKSLRDEIRRNNEYYYMQWYFDYGNGLEKNNVEKRFIDFNKNTEVLIINIPTELKKIRIDPLNTQCALNIKKLVGVKEGRAFELSIESSNADFIIQNSLVFYKNDAQFYIDINKKDFEKVIVEMQYNMVDDFDRNHFVSKIIDKANDYRIITEQKENYINEQRKIIEDKEHQIDQQERQIDQQKHQIDQQEHQIREKESEIAYLKSFLNKPIINILYNKYVNKKNNDNK